MKHYRFVAALFVVLFVASMACAEIALIDTPGQVRTAWIEVGVDWVSVDLVEDTGEGAGTYRATDAEITARAVESEVDMADNTSPGYLVKFRPGTTSAETPLNVSARLYWLGNQEYDPLANAGGGGSFSETEKAQVMASLAIGDETGVPAAQTFVVKRQDNELKALSAIPKDSQEKFDVLFDFRAVIAPNDAIKSQDQGGIIALELIDDGNEGDQITSTAFTSTNNAEVWMNSGVRLEVDGGTAGQSDRIRCKAATIDGKILSVIGTVKVTGH